MYLYYAGWTHVPFWAKPLQLQELVASPVTNPVLEKLCLGGSRGHTIRLWKTATSTFLASDPASTACWVPQRLFLPHPTLFNLKEDVEDKGLTFCKAKVSVLSRGNDPVVHNHNSKENWFYYLEDLQFLSDNQWLLQVLCLEQQLQSWERSATTKKGEITGQIEGSAVQREKMFAALGKTCLSSSGWEISTWTNAEHCASAPPALGAIQKLDSLRPNSGTRIALCLSWAIYAHNSEQGLFFYAPGLANVILCLAEHNYLRQCLNRVLSLTV